MDNRELMELSSRMQNGAIARDDFARAQNLFFDYFRETYMSSFMQALKERREYLNENPTREIAMLQTMRGFAPPERQAGIDRMIELFLIMNTASVLREDSMPKSISQAEHKPNTVDTSVHDDGIYDIDHSCLTRKPNQQNMFGIMLMAALMNRN